MNRFAFVLQTSFAPGQVPLDALTKAMADAVEQSGIEGVNPLNDPAVLVLGAYIAFHTDAATTNVGGYRTLLTMCQDKLIERQEICQ